MREWLRGVADTCSTLERRHWVALVVALVGVHIVDVAVALEAWLLESNPVATALGPTRWAVVHAAAVAIVLAAAWAVRALGSEDHDDALAVGVLGVGIATGLAGPIGNLAVLTPGPALRLTIGGLTLVAAATALPVVRPRVPVPTLAQGARVAVAVVVVASLWTGILAQPGAVGTADAAPADVEWTYPTQGDIFASPTIADGTVYVGSFDGNLYAVDADTGAQKWEFDIGSDIRSSATVANGTVYVGSTGGALYAIDAETGTQQWVESTESSVRSSPTVRNGSVYFATRFSQMYSLDADTGATEWQEYIEDDIFGSPTIVNGTVFITDVGDPGLHALDADTGNELWDAGIEKAKASPTVADGTVYVGVEASDLYAVDAQTGTIEWTFKTGGNLRSSPTVADGTVYVGSFDQKLYAVDADTGTQEWEYGTSAKIQSSPTVADGTVYVGDRGNTGTVHAVDAESGTEQWTYATGTAIQSSPTVADGTVYVGSFDGNLYALDTAHSASSSGTRVTLDTLGGLGDASGGGDGPTASVSGQVLDTSGGSIGGATILAWNRDTATAAGNTTTNATGAYNLSLAPGNYTLSAVSQNHTFDSTDITVPDTTTANITLAPLSTATDSDPEDTDGDGLDDDVDPDDDDDGIPDGADPDDDNDGVPDISEVVVDGVVYNQSQVAILDANVTATQAGSFVNSDETDVSGDYQFRVGYGTYNLSADADGYYGRTASIDTTGRDGVTRNFQLTKSEPPVISLVDPTYPDNTSFPYQPDRSDRTLTIAAEDPDGSGVNVTFYRYNRSQRQFVEIGTNQTSNGDNTTIQSPTHPGRNFWYAVAEDATGAKTVSKVGGWAAAGELLVSSVPGENVAFLIDDRQTNADINSTESAYRQLKTAQNGSIQLTGVPNEEIRIEASAPGYENLTFTLPGPGRRVDVILQNESDDPTVGDGGQTPILSESKLFGQVTTRNGRGVPNTTVTVQNPSTFAVTATNATGWYGFANLSNGTYDVSADPDNNSLVTTEGDVAVDGRTRLNITVRRGIAPTFIDGSESPTGVILDQQTRLEIGVDDLEFRTDAGDFVSVTFYLNGQAVGVDSTRNTSLVSTPVSLPAGQTSTWYAVATDNYSRNTTSATFSVTTPSEIVLRNETPPHANLTSLSNATVTFYAPNSSEDRAIGDETIDLTGVPLGTVQQPTVAEFQADGYYSRGLILDSLAEQQTAYLLSKTATASEIVFQLEDRTGQFPTENTTIEVKRPINVSGSSEYRTVTSGVFGASDEFTTTLEEGIRYRIVVENGEGDRRVLGPYRVTGDDVAPLVIGNVRFSGGANSLRDAELRQFTSDVDSDGTDETFLRISYRDGSGATREFRYTVRNETSGATVATGTVSSPQNYSRTVKVSDEPVDGTTWNMTYQATVKEPSGDFITVQGIKQAGLPGQWAGEIPLDPRWMELLAVVGIVAIGGLVVIIDSALAALVSTIAAAFFVIIGAVSIPYSALGLAGAISIFAVVGRDTA
jgi:outer membrane protein assembly factor BamB